LTGFKWIGNVALSRENEGKTVLFGFEEAIGFMVGSIVPDKDGISALAVLAELASSLYAAKSNLNEYLHSLYAKYGYFVSSNSYFLCHDPEKIKLIFKGIRYYYLQVFPIYSFSLKALE
jgi:phosphomannomutase